MAETGSERLDSKILDWLQKQGYSLEMRVAQVFREAGFEVSQFESYVDPNSGDLREIDVVASLDRQIEGVEVSVALFVECKYCRTKPWLILASPRRFHAFSYFSRILRGSFDVREWRARETLQARLLARVLISLGRIKTSEFDFFSMPLHAGYGIVEAFKDRQRAKDNAYTAVMQASSCVEAHDLRNEMSSRRVVQEYKDRVYEGAGETGEFSLFCSIAFPVVVMEGRLFECHLDEHHCIAISERNSGTVLLSSRNRGGPAESRPYDSVVRVVTEGYLGSLANQAHQGASALLSQGAAIREVWEHERPRVPRETDEGDIPF